MSHEIPCYDGVDVGLLSSRPDLFNEADGADSVPDIVDAVKECGATVHVVELADSNESHPTSSRTDF